MIAALSKGVECTTCRLCSNLRRKRNCYYFRAVLCLAVTQISPLLARKTCTPVSQLSTDTVTVRNPLNLSQFMQLFLDSHGCVRKVGHCCRTFVRGLETRPRMTMTKTHAANHRHIAPRSHIKGAETTAGLCSSAPLAPIRVHRVETDVTGIVSSFSRQRPSLAAAGLTTSECACTDIGTFAHRGAWPWQLHCSLFCGVAAAVLVRLAGRVGSERIAIRPSPSPLLSLFLRTTCALRSLSTGAAGDVLHG